MLSTVMKTALFDTITAVVSETTNNIPTNKVKATGTSIKNTMNDDE